VRFPLGYRTLQKRLEISVMLLCVTVMAAVALLTWFTARQKVEEGREDWLKSVAEQTAGEIESALRETVHDLEFWGDMALLQRALQGEDRTNRVELQDFFNELVDHHPEFDLILATDMKGELRAWNNESIKTGLTLPVEDWEGRKFQDVFSGEADWLRRLVEGDRVWGVAWKELDLVNRLYGRGQKTERDNCFQVLIGHTVVRKGTLEAIGALVVVINWSHFQSILDRRKQAFQQQKYETGYAFMFAADSRTVIAHPEKQYYGTDLVKKHRLPELLSAAERQLPKAPPQTIRYTLIDRRTDIPKPNPPVEKIAALYRIHVDQLGPEFDWVLGAGLDHGDIYRPVESLKLWYVAIPIGVAIVLMFSLSRLLERTVRVSLKEFAQLARDAARGRLPKMTHSQRGEEVDELAGALNEMVVSLRSRQNFGAMPNPYVVGNPLRTTEMFFGRREDLEWVSQHLERPGNEMILLFGSRRIGKTSLLHQILAGKATEKCVPFFFDTQQIIPELQSDGDFFHVVTREMLAQLPSVLPGANVPFIGADRFTPEILRRLLKHLQSVAPGRPPVLLFDELENLEIKLARGQLTADLLFFLGHLIDGDIPVSFVATGSDELDRMRSPAWQNLVPKTISKRIGLLTPNDARSLILDPVRGYVQYGDSIPERILRFTAGHPYYTQVTCQAVVDYLNHKQQFHVEYPDYCEIVATILDNPPPPLNHVWDTFSVMEKIAASGLAQILTDEETWARPEGIHAGLPEELQKEANDPVAFRAALDGLCRADWLEKGEAGSYRFQIDLLRLWLRREHDVWQVADHLQKAAQA
jgi:HAMP domain-containing protein